MVPVPSAVVSLVRKVEQVKIPGGDFYIDFEFVSLGRFREDEWPIRRFPVEIAVRRLDEQVIIDTLIKYDKLIPDLLAGIPRTGSTVDLSGRHEEGLWARRRDIRKEMGQSQASVARRRHEQRQLCGGMVQQWDRLQFLEDDHATTHSFKIYSTYPFLEDRPPRILKYETELLLCLSLSGFHYPRARSPGES